MFILLKWFIIVVVSTLLLKLGYVSRVGSIFVLLNLVLSHLLTLSTLFKVDARCMIAILFSIEELSIA